jgi:methylmalonyl-CoA mutase
MFIAEDGEEQTVEPELMRATPEEEKARLAHLADFHKRYEGAAVDALASLQRKAREGGKILEELLKTVRSWSLAQISSALYEVGGQYRRSMKEQQAKRVAAMNLTRPTRHRNSSDELPTHAPTRQLMR